MGPRAGGLRSCDSGLFLSALCLVAGGLVMTFSASYAFAANSLGSPTFFIKRQLIAAAIGIVLLLVACRVAPGAYAYAALGMIVASGLLLIAVLIPGIGIERQGARRWIPIGGLLFQPSEFAKVAVVLYLARIAAAWQGDPRHYATYLRWSLVPVAIIFGLVLCQPDLSTALLIAVVSLSVMFFAGLKWRDVAITVGAVGLAAVFVIGHHDYMQERIEYQTDANVALHARNYQIHRALIGLGTGGWQGRGLTASAEKFGYLPERHNDAIFAIVGEELGLGGTGVLILLFGWLAWRGFRVAREAGEPFARLVAGGLTTGLLVQALVNMAVVTDLVPTTGMTLPFISYGGSSLLIVLLSVGVLLSMSRSVGAGALGERALARSTHGRGYRRSPVPPAGYRRRPAAPRRARAGAALHRRPAGH